MGHCQWELYIKNGDAMFQGIMRIAQGIWINNGEYKYIMMLIMGIAQGIIYSLWIQIPSERKCLGHNAL
jgi:hypothetical protein